MSSYLHSNQPECLIWLKQNTPLDSNTPVLLRISGDEYFPNFSITRLAFIEYFGGIYAHPSVRGGRYFETTTQLSFIKQRDVICRAFFKYYTD